MKTECHVCGKEVDDSEIFISDDGFMICPDCYYDALYDEEI